MLPAFWTVYEYLNMIVYHTIQAPTVNTIPPPPPPDVCIYYDRYMIRICILYV